jgi:hypothetical protein
MVRNTNREACGALHEYNVCAVIGVDDVGATPVRLGEQETEPERGRTSAGVETRLRY